MKDLKGDTSTRLYDHRTGKVPPLDAIPRKNLRVKRLFDLCLGIPALMVSAPLLVLILALYMAVNRLRKADAGPVLFRLFRHARGKTVRLVKFRVSSFDAMQKNQFLLQATPLSVILKDLSIILGTFRIVLEHQGV